MYFVLQGLYIVTDLYPFHLQARKVSEMTATELESANLNSLISGRWDSLSHHSYLLSFLDFSSLGQTGGGPTALDVFIPSSWFYSSPFLWKKRKN
jgi:hypothetical protein